MAWRCRWPRKGYRKVTVDQLISRVLPQFFPAHWLEQPGIAFTRFPSRIRIGYVLRVEGGYGYVMEDELTTLRLPLPEVHAAALKNLAELGSGKLAIGKVPGGAEGWISAEEDNFAAVRILLPQVQQVFRESLGPEFLVSLPHRDWCFCWSPTQSPERQKQHAEEALEDFTNEDYNLTPDILLCTESGFRVHMQQSTL